MDMAGAPQEQPLLWDVFCHVVDNLGDVGVCWRLCANLAERGQRVRLWIDAPESLDWMAPGALEGRVPGVQVLHTQRPFTADLAQALDHIPVADVWVETFGGHPPPECMDRLAAQRAAGHAMPVWLNLEYMSAEPYVERSHRLPSPVSSGPLKGLAKWFFYPGFTNQTGGLLREPNLFEQRAAFDASAWRRRLDRNHRANKCVSLFCYEPMPLKQALQEALAEAPHSRWWVTAGRAQQAVARTGLQHPSIRPLPLLTQTEFDHLLWCSDLNCVRGEDSLVRALWAGQPLVWHIYPQDDNAHHAKLHAFLDWLQAPASLRRFHLQWNGVLPVASGETVWPGWGVVQDWRACVQAARQRLSQQPDLCQRLSGFVWENR